MKTFMSRRVADRRSFAVTVSLAILGTLMTTACTGHPPPISPTPSGSAATGPLTPTATSTGVPSPTSSGSGGLVVGLSGWLYYYSYPQVYRLTPAGLELVAVAPDATVSPDGLWIAYVDDSGVLLVADRDGGSARPVLSGVIGTGYEPAWSPDSTRLLVARPPAGGNATVTLGVVDVASGVFTPLPYQPEAIHPLWSADGQHLGFATGTCQLMLANADGSNTQPVPVVGDPDPAVNPQRRASCDPYSISPDGTLMAVNQRVGDEPYGDIGRDLTADVVIDTRTGAEIALPVSGQLSAVLFLPNGQTLVRSTNGNTYTLTLLNPDLTINTQVTEPPAANANPCGQSTYGCALLAYTPN